MSLETYRWIRTRDNETVQMKACRGVRGAGRNAVAGWAWTIVAETVETAMGKTVEDRAAPIAAAVAALTAEGKLGLFDGGKWRTFAADEAQRVIELALDAAAAQARSDTK